MSNLTQSELTKFRKSAIYSFTLSSEMKNSVVEAKLRELSAEIKRVLTRKGMAIEIFVTATGAD